MSLTKVTYSMITGAVANVLDYGADPSGTSDSTPAFQDAFDSGLGRVYIPVGDYKLLDTVTVGQSVRVTGGGMRETTLQWYGNDATKPMITTGNGAVTDNVVFEDFGLNNHGTAKCGIEIKCVRAVCERLFSNSTKAFNTSVIQTDITNTCFDIVLRDCSFFVSDNTSVTPYGYIGARGHTFDVIGCMFSGFGVAGVRLGGYTGGAPVGEQVVGGCVVGSRFESFSNATAPYPGSATAVGLWAREVEGLTVAGCNFEFPGDGVASAAAQRPIKLQVVNGAAVTGNYFSGVGQATGAIDIADIGCVGVTIEGNTFHNFNGPAVVTSGTGDITKVDVGYNQITSGTTQVVDQTFTPTFTTGGSSTGWTFASKSLARRIGLNMQYDIQLTFSGKSGTTAGNARISVPVAALSTGPDIYGSALLSTYTTKGIQAYLPAGSTAIWLIAEDGTQLADTNFTSSSVLNISLLVPVQT